MAKTVRQRAPKKRTAKTRSSTSAKGPPPKTKKTRASKTTRKAKSESVGFDPPLALMIYGPGGVGKTSFAAHFPSPKFIIGSDEGINDLANYEQVPVPHSVDVATSFEELLELAENAISQDCETVVFDNLTDFETLCFDQHCNEYFEGDWSSRGFYSYNKGPKNAAKVDWKPRFLGACQDLLTAGKNVILIAHSRIKPVPNPSGEDWIQYEPELDSAIWQMTHYWCKATLFYGLHTEVKKDGTRTKAASGEFMRFLFTEPSPSYVAKNRFGLPAVLDCGESGESAFQAFAEAILN